MIFHYLWNIHLKVYYFVEVLINNAVNIIVGEIYRVPNPNRHLSIQYYEDIISKLQYENKEVILGTDHNFDYLNSTCAHSKHLLETYFSAGFIPTITRPTRITHASATLIDNIYVKCKQLGNNTVSCILLKSSHNLNQLRSKIYKNNNNVSINDYNIYRNLYNRLIRIAKATHYSEQIEQHRGNISKTWNILNKLLGKNHKSSPQIFNINNFQTEDKSKINNAFCSYLLILVISLQLQ